ncbi:MAG: DUF1553 domain-containing protein [Planctomycetaceae bacterium]|nr:DUF1553 domain-containing protein [Planctomycetaceae bacterium]
MRRILLAWTIPVLALVAVTMPTSAATPDQPGPAQGLMIEPALTGDALFVRGRDARQQLIVSAQHADSVLTDVTRTVTFSSEPANIVAIDATGLVTPLADGETLVTAATAEGISATIKVRVEDFAQQTPINFTNQIVPIFTKYGCNGGGCHGKASGQNGFKLSLLGFVPEDDHEFLRKEARGRRIFLPAPDRSLLLMKATGRSPHGGGKRLEPDSHEYRLVVRWIEQGMPYGSVEDPKVVGIRCVPEGRLMPRSATQQIAVLAEYSNGSVEDVTRMALYEPNNPDLAEVGVTGLVTTLDLAGEVAIMARYQGQVATFRSTIPLGAEVANLPPVKNFVDEAVFHKLTLLGIPPSPVCDDATYLRRVHVDITGTTPSEEEVRVFLADADPEKRAKLVDRLLDSPQYADYFANKWNMVLRNKKRNADDLAGTFGFYQWIWDGLYENKPYDQMVSEIITASGDPETNPAVIWYREVGKMNEQVEDVAQLFLGIRIQCARCHHHPFEKWSQDDYYSFAAFFSRIGTKNLAVGLSPQAREKRLFHNEGVAQAQHPRSGKQLQPAGLGSAVVSVAPDRDPRIQLAAWMSDPQNPYFARSLVNRYWKHFFDRGIVEPEDDMRETNPPSNPELLAGLAQHFVDSHFDLKDLVRTICTSSTYQLTSLPNDYNLKDKQNFSRYYPKRLSAEVLYDAFHQVTGSTQAYSGLPPGTTAMQLRDVSIAPYFLKVFGQPAADTACECERSMEANLAQSLHLLNSSEVQGKIAAGGGRAATYAADKTRTDEEKLRELYRWVYSRDPDAEELAIATAHLAKHADNPQLAYEDIVWALVNTKEFLFNH